MCPYCDFNSHVAEGTDQKRWRAAYRAEIEHAAATGPRLVTSVYFGGGTPSLMEPATVAAVLQAVGGAWTLQGDAEITLEANPDDLSPEKLRELKQTPVNRLSIGIQSFHDVDLRFMNRAHSAEEASSCIENTRAAGFENLTIDLIYGAPTTGDAQWEKNIQLALDFEVPHLSCYCLTV
ncbi:MAG: radical SAM protein, partial [Alphaproteobacteria bacterium]|nr:radical SAM protein [Alphaproteobacteria bacterium]